MTAGGPRRATLAFIFTSVALDVLALGVMIPVLPKLVVELTGGETAHAAEIYGLFATLWAVMQFLAQPLLGALSDRIGRRPVILAANLGLALDYVLMALAPSVGWLFVGRAISGFFAGGGAAAQAYIADVTPPEKRARGYGLVGAAFGLGFVLGPALGGLLGSVDPRLPFWTAAALGFANFLFGVFVLPESLPRERRTPVFEWRRANPIAAFAFLGATTGLGSLALAHFLQKLAHVALPATFVLYAHHRYGWDDLRVGAALAAVGLVSAIAQGALVGPARARLGERGLAVLGFTVGAASFLLSGLAAEELFFALAIPLMGLWSLAAPAVTGLASQRVAADAQGRLQGALGGLGGVAGIVGPGLFTLAFARGIDGSLGLEIPGIAFFASAAMLLAAAFVVARRVQSASSAGMR
ncbi:MAG: MFS transporter [Azospirillum sp.]|nr:MFS transporter [Azospirillum sp.]